MVEERRPGNSNLFCTQWGRAGSRPGFRKKAFGQMEGRQESVGPLWKLCSVPCLHTFTPTL